MELRVVHVVAPNFGYTFSGQIYPITMLLSHWQNKDINLDLFGTDYRFTAITSPERSGEFNENNKPLWGKSVQNTKIRRLLWTIQLISMLILNNREYDIIHFHVQWWGTLISPLIAHLFKKKVIYLMSLEGSDNPSAVAAESLGKLKLSLLRKFDGLIGLSPALIEDCRKHGFSSNLLALPNFLTIESPVSSRSGENRLEQRKKWNIPDDSKVLLFVGSMIKRKGIDLVIDAFIRLSKEFDGLWLVMVGPDNKAANPRVDESFIEQQRKKIELAGSQDRVIWTGLVVDRNKLAGLYQISDVFFFPTRAEGQGNVILEAMSAELPVVVSRLPGVTDMMISNEENGFLHEVDDLEGFITSVRKLLMNPDLRLSMGKNGRERVMREFDFNTYCEKLANFYLQVAQNRR